MAEQAVQRRTPCFVGAVAHMVGKYRLVAELGHGGMADVFLALVEGPAGSGFSKLAVVKRLRANLAEDPEFVAMLIDEARITARLNHPNVVQMLEVGLDNDEYFLAMEYLDGQPFHRIERRAERLGRTLSRTARAAVILDVLAGLHHAHELADYDGTPLEIVHRDVTPHNIFVTYDGQVKVMDFGIAKAAGRVQETRRGIVKGKVRYMSPEHAMGMALDRRADLFAVGILLWDILTGRRFWGDRDELGVIHALIARQYESSPMAVNPEVPHDLDAIVRKAIAPNLEDRYQNALEMRADLESALGAAAIVERRALVTAVGEMFEKERRELRAVVERAGKSATSASITILRSSTSSSGSVPAIVRTMPPAAPVQQRTQVMSSPAPPTFTLPPPPVASIATASAPLAPGAAPPGVPMASRPVRRSWLGATLVGVASASTLAIAMVGLSSPHPVSPSAARATVVEDIVPLAWNVRGMATSVQSSRPGGAAPRARMHFAAPSSTVAAVDPPASVSATVPSASTPPALSAPRSGSAARLKLDTTDPW